MAIVQLVVRMSFNVFWVYLLLCGVVAQVKSLQLTTSPNAILNELTSSLVVNCTFDTGSDPRFVSLTSLSVSRSINFTNLQYQVLSSVDSFNGVTVSASQENLTTLGVINNSGQSFLALSWDSPLTIKPGVYKCDATGFNSSGQPLTLTASADVKSTYVDQSTDLLVREIVRLRSYVNQINTQTSIFMNTWGARMNNIQKSLFKTSEIFKGSQYMLYNYQPTHVPGMAQATCQLYGGYLAEIQDSDEHDFIVSFISQFAWIKSLLVGGHQAGEVGNWVYPSNNHSLEYYRWAYAYPFDAMDYNCLVLWNTYDFNLTNQECTPNQPSGSLYYLCEVVQLN